jgi:hypothetical protein
MAIPQQVAKQEEAAQKKWKETYSNPDEDASEEPVEETVPEEEELPLAAEEAEETEQEQEEEQEQEREEDWQHKFSVLEGKYRAEVPRLHEENRMLRDELAQIRAEFDALKSSAQPHTPTAPSENQFMDQYFPDLDQQGREQFMAMVRKTAEAAIKPISDDLGATKTEAKRVQTGNFWKQVNQSVPDYENLTTNPALIGWLNERMPGTNFTRLALMEQAFQSLDADRYVEFIDLWKQGQETPTKQAPNAALKQKVTPPKAGGAGKAKADKKTYTQAEYKNLMAKATRLNTDRSYQAARKILTELDSAQKEGRITP